MSRSSWLSRLGSLALTLVMVSGCATKLVLSPIGTDEANRITNLLAECVAHTKSARILVNVSDPSDPRAAAVRYAIAMKAPDRFRLDLLPRQGAYAFGVFVVRNQEFLFLDQQQRTFDTGPATTAAIERAFGIGISPADLQSLLTGCVPPRYLTEIAAGQAQVKIGRNEGGVLMITEVGTASVFTLDESARVVNARYAKGRNTQVAVTYGYSADTTVSTERAPALPVDMSLEIVPHSRTVLFTVERSKAGAEIPDALFEVSPPSNYRRASLE